MPSLNWQRSKNGTKALRALGASALVLIATVPASAASAQTVVGVTVGASPVGAVSRGLFGVDLYWAEGAEGAFDAKAHEFYPGFVQELRRLGISAVRYPGGTTSDSFHWERAVGPEARRRPNEPYGVLGTDGIVDGPEPSAVGPDKLGRLLVSSAPRTRSQSTSPPGRRRRPPTGSPT